MTSDTIFEGTNPNAAIFTVDTEQGATPEDKGHSMIGDATMKHQSSLRPIDRVIYHELLTFPDGNIMAMEDNTYQVIHDFRDMDSEAAEAFLESKGVCMDPDGEDIYESGMLTAISLEDYEKNIEPYEIPSTPRPKFRHCGNVNQVFYDVFPEDHPEANKINMLLMMIKSNADILLSNYIHTRYVDGKNFVQYDWYENWADYFTETVTVMHDNGSIMSTAIANSFIDIGKFISTEHPTEDSIKSFISAELKEIDDDYGIELQFESECKSLLGWEEEVDHQTIKHSKNEGYAYLSKKEKEWELSYKRDARDANLLAIYKDIMKTGSELFNGNFNEDESGVLKARKNRLTWSKYASLKRKYAPRLKMNGIDINKCFHSKVLCDTIGFTQCHAEQIVSRLIEKEFKSLDEVFAVIDVDRSLFHTTKEKRQVDEIVNIIDDEYEKAIKYKTLDRFLKVSAKLMKKRDAGEFTSEFTVWKTVWDHHRTLKADILERKRKLKK